MGLIDGDKQIPAEVVSYLNGQSKEPITSTYFSKHEGKHIPFENFTTDAKHIEILKKMIDKKSKDSGLNILLYGQPGTGKTEFARSLGHSLGLEVYEIRQNYDKKEDLFRFRALSACQNMVDFNKSLVIIDESDALLNSESMGFFGFFSTGNDDNEKAMINNTLDCIKGVHIWITNKYEGINSSTKRRFDYSIHFPKLTFTQRKNIWANCVKKHAMDQILNETEIEVLADKYEINAGGIDVALRNCKRILSTDHTGQIEFLKNIDVILSSHLKLMGRKTSESKNKAPNSKNYSIEGLNIKGDLGQMLGVLESFNKYWENPDKEIKNMNVLFFGPPGTGKTELAKYIARKLNRPLIVKQTSDLLSKWVGESEKMIRDAFEQAQAEKAILFIDEADGLFASREGASQSWQVTQANELLTNMETLEGILICSTNFKKNMDAAAMRRFNIKLEFDFLKPEGNISFYNRILTDLIGTPLTEQKQSRIMNLKNLTPGDFKVVYQKNFFIEKEKLTHTLLIDALEEEVRQKDPALTKKLGFF
jgi:SpoVK/Ycf46/Vps4 family AAA+-type ATPase